MPQAAENRQTDTQTGSASHDPAFRRARCVSLAISSIAFALFATGVYLLAHYGEPWVNELDDRVGEVVAARAKALADAGETAEAIATYRKALDTRFDDPRQRVWKSQELVSLLVQEKRYEDALEVASRLFQISPSDGLAAFRDIQKPLRSDLQYEKALNIARKWCDWARAEDRPNAEALGKTYMGLPYKELGQEEKAAQSVLEAFELDPTVETAIVGARLLRDLHRTIDAMPLLDFAIAHGDKTLGQEAEAIKRAASGK